jgi:hypothetical protein
MHVVSLRQNKKRPGIIPPIWDSQCLLSGSTVSLRALLYHKIRINANMCSHA